MQRLNIKYKIFGQGQKTIIIDTCLGSCSAEWWHIAQNLSHKFRVLVFDRPGYGQSPVSNFSRTPENIVQELNQLLEELNINKNLILVGHSQGGLNLVLYALTYTQKIDSLILLDPATPFDDDFKKHLTPAEFKNSGVDKTLSYKFGLFATSLYLGFLFKPLLLKSPPFYYHQFSLEAKKYLLQSLIRKNTYQTALNEYQESHKINNVSKIVDGINKFGLKNIPLKLITHSSKVYINELQKFGGLDLKMATKIETIWQDLMKKYLSLSRNCEHISAPHSGHYIHLTDQKLLEQIIYKFR